MIFFICKTIDLNNFILESAWPDVGIKSCSNFSQSCPKWVATAVFVYKARFYNSQKVTKYLGYFSKKICHQEVSKIAQSGHPAWYALVVIVKFLVGLCLLVPR